MITFDQVRKTYPDGTVAVGGLSFNASDGSITVLVGPSGCGKTTILRMINRLIEPSAGVISLDGVDTQTIDRVQLRRKMGYVIQNAGLFPHRTVVDNIAALPRLLGASKRGSQTKALELLNRVGLDERFACRYPWQLSGGQQQRVGVARALATDPPVLLMDEPFSAVDPIVRAQLQDEFLKLQSDISKTIVMVTHDIDEALRLGDQVILLREGGDLAQAGSPYELLKEPVDFFVANFVGEARGYRALGFELLSDSVPLRREALVKVGEVAINSGWAILTDEKSMALGWVNLHAVHDRPLDREDVVVQATLVPRAASLKAILNAALVHPIKRAGLVSADGTFLGSVTVASVLSQMDGQKL